MGAVKRGRPPKAQTLDRTILLRLTKAEKRLWRIAAQYDKRSLSAWIRKAANDALERKKGGRG